MKKNVELVIGDVAHALHNVHIRHDRPQMTARSVDVQGNRDSILWLEAWMRKYPDTRLVVVDTFKPIRPVRKRSDNIYNSDYEDAAALTKFANAHKIALVVIHHRNQGKTEGTRSTQSAAAKASTPALTR